MLIRCRTGTYPKAQELQDCSLGPLGTGNKAPSLSRGSKLHSLLILHKSDAEGPPSRKGDLMGKHIHGELGPEGQHLTSFWLVTLTLA